MLAELTRSYGWLVTALFPAIKRNWPNIEVRTKEIEVTTR